MGDFAKNYKKGEKQRKKYEEYLKKNDRKKLDEEAAKKGRQKAADDGGKRQQASRNYMRSADANARHGGSYGKFGKGQESFTSRNSSKKKKTAFERVKNYFTGDYVFKGKDEWNRFDYFANGSIGEWLGGIVRAGEWVGDATGLAKEKDYRKRKGSQILRESSEYIDTAKEGLGKVGQIGIDIASQGAMMGLDKAVTLGRGRLSLLPMGVRAFGSSAEQAANSGASIAQQGLYGGLSAGVEIGTEGLFSAGSKLVYGGKGALDRVSDKTAKKISEAAKRFIKTEKGQNLMYHAVKAGLAANEEGFEEAVSDAVNPIIQRITYDKDALKQYGDPEYWSDMAYDYVIGAALGGIMGTGSQAMDYRAGRNMTRQQQEAAIERGLKSDESSESYSFANQLMRQSERGENILPGQFYELAKKNAVADNRAAKQYNDIYRDTLDNETFRKAQEGFDEEDVERAKAIAAGRETEAAQQAKNVLMKQGVEETQADEYAQSIGRIVAGTAGYADTEVFQGNSIAKEAFEKVTGATLPADNESTRKQITQYAAGATYNLAVNMRADIESEIAAENDGSFRASDGTVVETPVMITSPADVATFRKSVKKYTGEVAQRLAADYTGHTGVREYTDAFNAFYDAGKIAYSNPKRFNFTWANKINSAWRDYLSVNAARDAYLAGVKAARLAEEKKNNAKTAIEKKGKSEVNDKSSKLSETQSDMVKALAEKTGLDITIAEKLQKVVDGVNVELNGSINVAMGTLELSLDSDNLGQALAHELTHYTYALNKEGAKELREAVLSWYAEEKGTKSLAELLENKTQMYGDEVTAEEEFVADALAGIFSNDKGAESFAQWITDKSGYSVEQQRSVLQKLIDVIDSIVANIKAMFTGKDISGVSKDMRQLALKNQQRAERVRKIYLDALDKAAENYAGTETNGSNEVASEKYSIRKDSEGKDVVVIEEDIFKGREGEKRKKVVAEYLKNHIGDMFTIIEKGKNVYLGKDLPNEYIYSKTTEKLGKERRFAKQKAAVGIGEMIEIAVNERWELPIHKEKHKTDARYGFYKYDTRFAVRDRDGDHSVYAAELVIRHDNDGKLYLYDIQGIKKETAKIRFPLDKSQPDLLSEESKAITNDSSYNILAETDQKSNEKFSMKEPVEETKDLIAVHNLNDTELAKIIKLGGFPMPSIAIKKTGSQHNEYGNTSVLFAKETIDPELSAKNKVYGGDAWTPTYPAVEYKANEKVSEKISERYYDFARKYGYDEARPLYNIAHSLEDELDRHNGEAGLIDFYKDDTGLMNFYLMESGKDKIQPIEKEIRTEMPEAEIEQSEYLINALGEDVINEIKVDDGKSPMARRKAYLEKNGDKITSAYKRMLSEEYGFSEEQVNEVIEQTRMFDYIKMINAAYKYLHGDTVSIKTETDLAATTDAIKKAAEDGYEKWLNDLLSGSEEKSGIRNDKDLYTASGNRRSFDATHYAETLENVVKVMSSQDIGQGFFGFSGIWGVAATEYKNIEEIKADKDRLKTMPEEEYNKIKENFGERMQEIANSIADQKADNYFIELDNIMENIVNAVRNSKTKSGILSYLKKYYSNATETTANDIVNLVRDISVMPTEYFEAKPQRAVKLDEIKAVIIPESTGSDVISALKDNGIPYTIYDGTESDRLAKMNAEAENKQVKFSIKETDRSTQKLLRENKKYKQLVADLKRQMRLSKGRIPDKSEINKYVNRLRAEYSSKVDKEQLTNALTNLYGYIADEDAKADQVWDVARSIATDVIENSTYNREISDYAKGILKDIKSSKVALSETQKQEVAYVYGSYAEYKRMNKGVNASDNGIYLDEKWQEWAETYPDLFDMELTEPEQGVRLAEITKALSEDYVNEFGFDLTDATDMLAAEIAIEIAETSEMVTFADEKKQQQVEKLAKEKAKNRERINTLKKQYKEKYQQGMAKQREKSNQRLIKQKEKSNQKLVEQLAAQREKSNQKLTQQRDKAKEQLARQKAKYEQRAADTRTRADRKEIKTQIEKDVKYLTGMLLSPTDTKHIPEGYQYAMARMLAGFDFSTTRTEAWAKKYGHLSRRMLNFANLNAELVKIAENSDGDIILDDFVTELADKLSNDLDGRKLDSLTNEELQDVKTLIKAIRYSIGNINRTFSDSIRQSRAETGDMILEEVGRLKDKKHRSEFFKMFDEFLNSSNVKPIDFFEVMGGTTKEVFGAVVDGFDKHIMNIDSAMKYIQDVTDKKNLKKLSNKNAKPTEFKLQSGETIELMPSQIMSLYCLMRRSEAEDHILKGGIIPTSISYRKSLKRHGIIPDKRKRVTYVDVANIIKSLTTEEKAIADKLQKFMANDCAAWGNETSMKLYGYKKFKDPNYFPVKSHKDFLESSQTIKAEVMPKLWTAGFTKAVTPGADNPIVVDDIFNVVTKHITEMSMYNALAPALLDFERIYNYKHRGNDGTYGAGTSVKEQIRRSYGDKAKGYIERLMRDLNNANKRDKVDDKIPNKLIANYKKAKIGFNLRVLLQQPTAIIRSALMINPKYLMAAQGKPAVKEMQEHCPISKWKGWGFYQTDVAPSLQETMLGQESVLDKAFMSAYGKADDITWSYIWKAVKKEVKAKNPDIEVGSDEFWNKCNVRAREVFYRTQVVDSMLSRSQIMRRDDTFAKMATAFMAEPTTTFNMMRTETIKTAKEWASGNKKAATKRMGKLLPVFIANAVTVSAVAAVADYMRDTYTGDDDDDETLAPAQKYLKYVLGNLNDNVNPLNMLPFLRDIYSLYSGYDVERMDMATFKTIYDDIVRLQKTYEQGADAKYTYEYCIRQLMLHTGELFGVPLANITREGETILKTVSPEGGAEFIDNFKYVNPDDVNRKDNYAALLSEDKDKSQKALEAIERDAEAKYQKYINEGKSESQAISAVRSSLSNYYKGAYQMAETDERSMITSRITQIRVNGRSVWEYADGTTKDFSEWGETE